MATPHIVGDGRSGATAPRVALALQGSFGHEAYSLGILSAFQRRKLTFHAASGCVATLLPLWLYFSRRTIDIADYFEQYGTELHMLLTPAAFDAQTWASYWSGLQRDALAAMQQPADYVAQRHLFGNVLGLAGTVVFNRSYFEGRRQEFETLMSEATVPIFTNALNAQNFNEVYLHCGPLSAQDLDRVRGDKWRREKREVASMNLDRFIASGARAPMLAPILVQLDPEDTPTHEARDEYWMEGAMRCNPPLNPLFDVGATTILLIRLFAKQKPSGRSDNQAELLDRYLEAIFTAPLEKELEFIEVMGKRAKGITPVSILDPATSNYVPQSGRSLASLVSEELDLFSHYDSLNPALARRMFEIGVEVGEGIVTQYERHLVLQVPERMVG